MAVEKFISEKRVTTERPHVYEVRWVEDGQELVKQFTKASDSYFFSAKIVGALPSK